MSKTRVLQLTDLHVFCEPLTRLKGIPTRESLQAVVDHILQHEPPFDHVVVTGDHTHDELPASYQAVDAILAPLGDPIWRVPGNHDDRSVLRDAAGYQFSGQGNEPINFDFDCGRWSCIGLDTHLPGEVAGMFNESQAAWLIDRLRCTQASAVALFMHHPPLDVGSAWMDIIGLNGRERLWEIVTADKRVRLICCGHVHHEFYGTLGQAAVMTTPATGVQFDPQGDVPRPAAEPPGYRVIEFADNEFQTRVGRLPEMLWAPAAD